jgi:hypothetical protein
MRNMEIRLFMTKHFKIDNLIKLQFAVNYSVKESI